MAFLTSLTHFIAIFPINSCQTFVPMNHHNLCFRFSAEFFRRLILGTGFFSYPFKLKVPVVGSIMYSDCNIFFLIILAIMLCQRICGFVNLRLS
ncbi:hypothetical protein M5689_002182 [Euphorbia peplus]|nr:hypothetical protein M5689_002182 [Euphorbia peplus]